jgi:tetratricopeptide (TPR) repeat protein
MFSQRAMRAGFLLVSVGWLLAGCDPVGSSPLDEEKDPHFLRGRSYLNAWDYDNAIRAFEEALKANPNSASAHKELGLLYYERRQNHARAIYHFQRLLELRPDDPHAANFKHYEVECKRALAGQVQVVPVNQAAQRHLEQIEQLKKENAQLQKHVEMLGAQLASAQQALRAAQAAPLVPNPTLLASNSEAAAHLPSRPVTHGTSEPQFTSDPAAPQPVQPGQPAQRTHVVKKNETPYGIARDYGVPLRRLLEANPTVNPNRMQIGQVLKIPSP